MPLKAQGLLLTAESSMHEHRWEAPPQSISFPGKPEASPTLRLLRKQGLWNSLCLNGHCIYEPHCSYCQKLGLLETRRQTVFCSSRSSISGPTQSQALSVNSFLFETAQLSRRTVIRSKMCGNATEAHDVSCFFWPCTFFGKAKKNASLFTTPLPMKRNPFRPALMQ